MDFFAGAAVDFVADQLNTNSRSFLFSCFAKKMYIVNRVRTTEESKNR